jgi:signal transduction histidine kinase
MPWCTVNHPRARAYDQDTMMPPVPHADVTSGTLEGELLHILGRQGRRMPLPVFLAAMMIAWQASTHANNTDAGLIAWLVLVAAVLVLRMVLLGRLPTMHAVPAKRRLDIAVFLSLLNGCTHALVLIAFDTPSDFPFAIQTFLLVGLCAGSVATTAGYRPAFLAYVVPVIGVLVTQWVKAGNVPIAFIIGMFGVVLVSLAADSFRLLRDSFDIRLEQVQLNERLRDALQQAESANRAKTRFLASASHDLRQPIHTVSLFAAALALRPLDPTTREISQHIDAALGNLTSQLDALLDISKLDAGVVTVHRASVPLAPFLRRMNNEYGPIAAEKALALKVDPGAHAVVLTDEVLLGRIVGNLLDNAIKYTQQGEVRLSLHLQAGLVILCVQDTGPGIPESEHGRIFEEFYQLDNPERNRTKGLGLGLSIVHRLADLLQARLEMVAPPGAGASFFLIMPEQAGAPSSAAATGYSGNALAGLTVLVIDDETAVQQAMQAMLLGLGAHVMLADGTAQALAALARRTPDLMLVDFRLRGGDDGIAAVAAVRACLAGLPAILISGDTSPERLREAHDAGIALLHKPVPVAQLQQLVAHLFTVQPEAEQHGR